MLKEDCPRLAHLVDAYLIQMREAAGTPPPPAHDPLEFVGFGKRLLVPKRLWHIRPRMRADADLHDHGEVLIPDGERLNSCLLLLPSPGEIFRRRNGCIQMIPT